MHIINIFKKISKCKSASVFNAMQFITSKKILNKMLNYKIQLSKLTNYFNFYEKICKLNSISILVSKQLDLSLNYLLIELIR